MPRPANETKTTRASFLSLRAAREVARRPGEGDAERAEMLNSAHWTVASYA